MHTCQQAGTQSTDIELISSPPQYKLHVCGHLMGWKELFT